MFEGIIKHLQKEIKNKHRMAKDTTGVLTQFTKDEAKGWAAEYKQAIFVLKNINNFKLPTLEEVKTFINSVGYIDGTGITKREHKIVNSVYDYISRKLENDKIKVILDSQLTPSEEKEATLSANINSELLHVTTCEQEKSDMSYTKSASVNKQLCRTCIKVRCPSRCYYSKIECNLYKGNV
jgi:Trp operon repressor